MAYIDIAPCPTTLASDVVLPGVIAAMECDGTFYRLDDVPVYFQPFTKSPFRLRLIQFLYFLSFSLIVSVVITAEAMNASSGFPK